MVMKTLSLLHALVRRYHKLMLSMTAVSLLGVTLLIGLGGAYDSLDSSMRGYIRDYHYPNIQITTALTSEEAVDDLLSIDGVEEVNCRMVADLPLRTSSGRILSCRAFSYNDADFMGYYVWDESRVSGDSIMVEKKFADGNAFRPGDTLELLIDGRWQSAAVSAVISSPDCLMAKQDAFSWYDNTDFGYIFINAEHLENTPLKGKCDHFLLRLGDRADESAVLQQAEAILGERVISSWTSESSPAQKKIDINLPSIRVLSVAAPAAFYAAMMAVIYLFISQMIKQSRRDIGVLRAMGFTAGRVRLLFCAAALLITVVASLLGILAGQLLKRLCAGMFAEYFALPHLTYPRNFKRALFAVLLTVALGQAAAVISTAQLSSISPTEAMARGVSASSAPVHRLDALFGRLGPGAKYGILSLLRNPGRFIFSVVCISASMAIILASFAFYASKNYLLTQLFDEKAHYGCQIFFDTEPDEALMKDISAIEGVSNAELILYTSAEFCANGHTETVLLNGIAPGTDKIELYSPTGESLTVPEEGLILDSHTAELLGVTAGDAVTAAGSELKVVALSRQDIARVQYASLDTVRALGDPDRYSLLCDAEDETGLLTELSEMPGYLSTLFTRVLRECSEDTFSTYDVGVFVLITFAALMGLIVIINTTQTNLLEQKKELSALRALGFRIGDISRIWFSQTALRFLLSCAVGLPAGAAIAKAVLMKMASEDRSYPIAPGCGQYLIAASLVLLYILASHYIAMASIRKWNIAEEISEKE